MSNTARKARKRAQKKYGAQYQHAVKEGTPFQDRLANLPRPIYGIATSPNATRFGITSRIAAAYRARGLGAPVVTKR